MDKLKELLSRCKCGVHLTVNQHRDYYDTPENALEDAGAGREDGLEIPEDVRKAMIETNTIIHLQFYPNTPVGFYEVWHHDLDAALDEALACLD